MALAFALHRLEPHIARVAPRPAGVLWLALYIGAWLFAFAGMAAVVDGGRVPSGLRRALEGVGVPFHALRDTPAMLYLLLMLAFLGLHLIAFWLGARRQESRVFSPVQSRSLAQLVLAGLVLRADPLWQRLAATNSGSANK